MRRAERAGVRVQDRDGIARLGFASVGNVA